MRTKTVDEYRHLVLVCFIGQENGECFKGWEKYCISRDKKTLTHTPAGLFKFPYLRSANLKSEIKNLQSVHAA